MTKRTKVSPKDLVDLANSAIIRARYEGSNLILVKNDGSGINVGALPSPTSGGAVTSVAGKTGVVVLAKVDVGLGNVDNTSDLNKPVSNSQAAINANKADLVGGVIPSAQIPAIAISEYLGAAANQVAMLALVGQKGDWTTRTDLGTTWVISGDDPAQLASWTALSYPVAPVSTVAGRTGAVTLTKADVGLGNVDNTADTAKPVSTAQQTAIDNAVANKIPTVTYSGSLTTARPTAPAVYWVGFPSTPTNAQAQDIVAAAPSPRIVQEYVGPLNLNSQAFPTSGGKLPTSVTVDVLIAAGTGGGSGRRGAAGTVRGGGGGGSGGGWARGVTIPASQFGTTWSLQLNAAGVGGAAVTADNTDGNPGTAGGTNLSQFFTGDYNVLANGGDTGKGGTASGGAAAAYGGAGVGGAGSAGQPASATGLAGVQGIYYGGTGPAGGSSGGGITAADVPSNGNDGSYNPYYNANKTGIKGISGGALPTSGTAIPGSMGTSGGSGAASKTAAAQAAAPSVGYGAGGSGGGASLNGFASGAGGAGGPSYCRLIWDYS